MAIAARILDMRPHPRGSPDATRGDAASGRERDGVSPSRRPHPPRSLEPECPRRQSDVYVHVACARPEPGARAEA